MIGHHARFRENDDLPVWRGPAAKKGAMFKCARANHAQNYAQWGCAMQYWGITLTMLRSSYACEGLS